MCVELTQSPMAVLILQDNAVVLVNGVRCVFTARPEFGGDIYLTTEDSDYAGYDARDAEEMSKIDKDDPHYDFLAKHMGECYYADYIKHVRRKGSGVGLYSRQEMADMLFSGDYEIA